MMANYKGVAALCVKPDEPKLLMVLQGMPGQPPTWTLPGGPIDVDETPEQAVVREAKEDAGLDVTVKRLYQKQEGTTHDLKKRPYAFECHYFVVTSNSDVLRPQDPDQLVYRAEWIDQQTFRSLGLYYEYQREVIKAFWTELRTHDA